MIECMTEQGQELTYIEQCYLAQQNDYSFRTMIDHVLKRYNIRKMTTVNATKVISDILFTYCEMYK